MLYCENCSAAWEESRCPLCGSTRLREAQEGDLCFLARKGRLFSTMLRDVLRDHEIPFTVRGDLGAGLAAILGEYAESDSFYVPYQNLAQARDLLAQFDAPADAQALEETDGDSDPEEEEEEEDEEDDSKSDEDASPLPAYADELVQVALDMGAVSCVPFELADICFDSRVLLKCMFGCEDWGKGLTCPSRKGSPSMTEYKEMFSRYRWGVIIGGHDKHITQKVSYALEKKAFCDGYYFAFSLSDCGLCKECAGNNGQECRHVRQARPAFHSVGIDVFKTVRGLGLPIKTLSDPDHEEQNWYAAVFVE